MTSKDKYFENKKKWREQNRDKDRDNKRRWQKDNSEKHRLASSNWSKNNKEQRKENAKKYRKKHPEKIRARNMANRCLKHLKKSGFEFHHANYSKPLLVEVLPVRVHHQIHS